MKNADELIPLSQAVGTLIPGQHNPSTVWRWVMRTGWP